MSQLLTIVDVAQAIADKSVSVEEGTRLMNGILAVQTAAAAADKIKLKMSDKGCVHMTGVNGQYGLALYPDQWVAVLSRKDDVLKFIDANKAELSKRSDAEKARKEAEKRELSAAK